MLSSILRERGGREPIGRAVLRHLLVEGVDEVEVGYSFYPAYWGRGLAPRAAEGRPGVRAGVHS
ncbi:MAG: GNAT family N-acetyltransferase [Gemmatimonadales bacterium]